MSSRWAVKGLPAVAAVLAAAALAGCSGGQAGQAAANPSPQRAVLLAARHADRANSVTATFTMRASGLIGMSLSGSVAERIRPSLLGQVTMTSMQVAGHSLPGGMTELITSKAAYLKWGMLDQFTGGKPWVEFRFSDLGTSGSVLSQLAQQVQDNDPLAQTRMLAGATRVREVGTGTIGGIPVTEYTGHYTMADAIAQLPASDRQAVRQQIAKAGLTGATFDLWLDDQQQVRKLIVTEHGTGLSMTIAMQVTSINQPVSARVPAASQVRVISAADLKSGA